jgi:serine phosphatase RsbU (regulator of sigma subunit)
MVVARDEHGRLVLVAVSEPQPRLRAPMSDQADIDALYGGGSAAPPSGRFVAVEPLRDEDTGAITGCVVATLPAAAAAAGAWAALWRNIIIAVLLFGAAAAILFRSVGRWVQQSETDRLALAARQLDLDDSISYAGKIQRALVPPPAAYRELFAGAFVIDRPKDLVSGDFHWCRKLDDGTSIVAAADATGHGLPGAMMAAIGCSLLNEIAAAYAHLDPAELLGMLNTRLVTTLHQQGRRQGGGDGLDIALCRIDHGRREILFAGAHRPLYWLHDGQLSVINGDRKPVGGAHHELERRFTCHRLAFAPGDRIYLFSDGYVDQLGGPEGKRFMTGRLQQLLKAHRHEPMERQALLLEQAFLDWKGSVPQVDDVCLLGIAV